MIAICLSMIYLIIVILVVLGVIYFLIEKLGVPLFWNDVKWTLFIYKNLRKLKKLDSNSLFSSKVYHVSGTCYNVIFYDSWLFEVYKEDSEYSLGGQSNKADYLTWWQKIIGKRIEKYYLSNLN